MDNDLKVVFKASLRLRAMSSILYALISHQIGRPILYKVKISHRQLKYIAREFTHS